VKSPPRRRFPAPPCHPSAPSPVRARAQRCRAGAGAEQAACRPRRGSRPPARTASGPWRASWRPGARVRAAACRPRTGSRGTACLARLRRRTGEARAALEVDLVAAHPAGEIGRSRSAAHMRQERDVLDVRALLRGAAEPIRQLERREADPELVLERLAQTEVRRQRQRPHELRHPDPIGRERPLHGASLDRDVRRSAPRPPGRRSSSRPARRARVAASGLPRRSRAARRWRRRRRTHAPR
jgi:hypothetical protein